MKVVLHGFLHGANFGDILYARIFYDKCKELGVDVDLFSYPFYRLGEFCRRNVGYTAKPSLWRQLQADAFVLVGGNLFGDNTAKFSFTESRLRFLRFVLPTMLFQALRKKTYMLGVGGAPIHSRFVRKCIVRTMNKAEYVTARDAATKEYFERNGVKSGKIVLTADTAQVTIPERLPALEEKEALERFADGRKKLFIHIPGKAKTNQRFRERVGAGILRYLDGRQREYCVVASYDNTDDLADPVKALQEDALLRELEARGVDVYRHHFRDVMQLCALLNEMDQVVTSKMHVGVVSSSLGKSVVSTPVHLTKTKRYYAQIGESERCVQLSDVDPQLVCEQLEKFRDRPICVPDDVRNKAKSNLDYMDVVCATRGK